MLLRSRHALFASLVVCAAAGSAIGSACDSKSDGGTTDDDDDDDNDDNDDDQSEEGTESDESSDSQHSDDSEASNGSSSETDESGVDSETATDETMTSGDDESSADETSSDDSGESASSSEEDSSSSESSTSSDDTTTQEGCRDFTSDTMVGFESSCLIWQRVVNSELPWREYEPGINTAPKVCEALEVEGKTDWRLPTIEELTGIVVSGNYPAADLELFPDTPFGGMWSSSVLQDGTHIEVIDFGDGKVHSFGTDGPLKFRCVHDAK
jgi:hypothetical protein